MRVQICLLLVIILMACQNKKYNYNPIKFELNYSDTLMDYSVHKMIEGCNIAYGIVEFGDTLKELDYHHFNGKHHMKMVLFANDTIHKENIKYFETDLEEPKVIEHGNKNDVVVIIDTTQIIPKANYYTVSVEKPGEKSKNYFTEHYYYEIKSLKKYYRDSNKIIYVKAFPVYIFNNSKIPLKFETRETWLPMILEAKINCSWKPIEFWDCKYEGDGQYDDWIMPGYVLVTSIFKYHGDYPTQVRVKILLYNKIYYSNPINMLIDKNQFNYLGSFNKDEYKRMKLEK